MGKGQILETILTRVSIIKTEFYSFVLEENQGTFFSSEFVWIFDYESELKIDKIIEIHNLKRSKFERY